VTDILNVDYSKPDAIAPVKGGALAPGLDGTVKFYSVSGGTVVRVDVCGLPAYKPALPGGQPVGPFGFHIHEGSTCGLGDGTNPFASAGGHYNPTNQNHGNHAGDMPVLFSNNGCAFMAFFTNKFKVKDIIGHTVIIHQNPDDFRTEPAGNSGARIACGVIGIAGAPGGRMQN
jgi:Cu-Zn family superoxide dismutase